MSTSASLKYFKLGRDFSDCTFKKLSSYGQTTKADIPFGSSIACWHQVMETNSTKTLSFPTNHFNATFKSLSRVAWIRLNMEALVETITVYLCWLQIFLIFSNSSCSHGENGAYLNRSQWARRRLDFLNFRLKILVHEFKMFFLLLFFLRNLFFIGGFSWLDLRIFVSNVNEHIDCKQIVFLWRNYF